MSACGSDANDAVESAPEVSEATSIVPVDTGADDKTPEGSVSAGGEAQDDPAPRSGQTTLADVDLLSPDDPGGFPRAPVPDDAFAASEVVVEATPAEVEAIGLDLQTDGHWVNAVEIETCTLIAVWALPNPSDLLVGYEEHPAIDCVRAVPRTVFFVIPMTGENGQGTWTYETAPAIDLQRRIG